MVFVKARPGEDVESMIRRFKRQMDASGILAECRKRESFEKPSVAARKKSVEARKREAKRQKKIGRRVKRSKLTFQFNEDKTEKKYYQPKNNYKRGPVNKRTNSKPKHRK